MQYLTVSLLTKISHGFTINNPPPKKTTKTTKNVVTVVKPWYPQMNGGLATLTIVSYL